VRGLGTCGTAGSERRRRLGEETEEERTWLDGSERPRMAPGLPDQVVGAVRLEIPPESLSTPQRLQTEGLSVDFELDPAVIAIDLAWRRRRSRLTGRHQAAARGPGGGGSTGDFGRTACSGVQFGPVARPALAGPSRRAAPARRHRGPCLHRPPKEPLLGLAVDTGTTKLAAYLVDLAGGHTLAGPGR